MGLVPTNCSQKAVIGTDQGLVVDLLPDELVLAEGVAGLSGDGVYRTLLHLLLHGTVEHEQRLPGTLLLGGGRRERKRNRDREREKVKG